MMMMRTLRQLFGVALALALATPACAWARVVKIETSAPLSDHSDQGIEQAVKGALDTCVRGATAMGLSWIWLDRAVVLQDKVVVQMIATDEEVEDEGDVRVLDPNARAL